MGRIICQPLVLEHLFCRRTLIGVNGETLPDEVTRDVGDIHPIFLRLEFVVAGEDGLHFELLSIAIEWGITWMLSCAITDSEVKKVPIRKARG